MHGNTFQVLRNIERSLVMLNRPVPIYQNSGSKMNNTFLLLYFPKPESQVWSFIYRKWSIDCLRKYCKNTVKYWVLAVFSRGEDVGYIVFSLTWPASMQIYWNKRKRFHKKGIQLPQDWFGTPTWPPFHCFGTPIWPPWRHVKTLYRWFSQWRHQTVKSK